MTADETAHTVAPAGWPRLYGTSLAPAFKVVAERLGARIALTSRIGGPNAVQLLTDLWRYGLCSALALAVDWGLMLAFIRLGLNYLAAATMSFLIGMAVAYVGSILFVYRGRRIYPAVAEALGFVLVGISGLIVNALLLFAFVKFVGLSAGVA